MFNHSKIDALARNIIGEDLEVKMARIESIRTENLLNKAKASILPKLSVNGEYQVMSDSGVFLDMDEGQFRTDFVLSFDFTPGIDKVGINRIDSNISNLEVLKTINSKVADALSSYFELYYTIEKKKILIKELESLKNDLKVAELGTKSGLFSDFEKTEILTEIDFKNIEILEEEKRICKIQSYFISTLGYPLDDVIGLNTIDINFNFDLLLNEKFIKSRPDVQCEYALIEKARIESKNSSNNLPSFGIDARVGLLSSDLNNFVSEKNFNTGVSINFQHTFFDGGEKRSDSKAAKANEHIAKIRYENAYRNTKIEINNLLNERNVLLKKYNLLGQTYDIIQGKLRILRDGFRNGVVEFEKMRDVKINSFRTKLDILKLKLDLTLNLIDLLKGFSF